MPRETRGNSKTIDKGRANRENSLSLPFQFPQIKTSFYSLPGELKLITRLLYDTGLRIREVLNLTSNDLLNGCYLHIESLKRSRERVIEVSPSIFAELIKQNKGAGLLFRTTYKEIYKFIKSGKAGVKLIKNKKNFSVCHTLRKLYIRYCLYELHQTVDEITEHIGWLKKTSILYYI